MPSTRVLIALIALPALACAPAPEDDVGDEAAALAALGPHATVLDATRTVCTTASIASLSDQIVAEMRCLRPSALVEVDTPRSITLGEAFLPFLSERAAAALAAVDDDGVELVANSGLRTVAQQFMVHRWHQGGRCHITAAAAPGRSMHETGQAVDVTGGSAARRALRAHGFVDDVAGDAPHFSFHGGTDLRGLGVQAFQRLWNRNHPDDLIAEDGAYSTDTDARVAQAPLHGFPRGACTTASTPPAPQPPSDPSTDPTSDPGAVPTDPQPADPQPTDPQPADPGTDPQPGDPGAAPQPGAEVPAATSDPASLDPQPDPPAEIEHPITTTPPAASTGNSSLRAGCSAAATQPGDGLLVVLLLLGLSLRRRGAVA